MLFACSEELIGLSVLCVDTPADIRLIEEVFSSSWAMSTPTTIAGESVVSVFAARVAQSCVGTAGSEQIFTAV